MPKIITHNLTGKGLTKDEVRMFRIQFGKNVFSVEKSRNIFHMALDIIREPMFLLLLVAGAIYFILGELSEGWMMIGAIGFVTAISFYEDIKSTNALNALKDFTAPKVTVLRDGINIEILSSELVPGDLMLLEEGNKISADGKIIHKNDLTVNESILTGESAPVDKDESEEHNLVYQGSTINTGKGYAKVTAIGNQTVLGKIGKTINDTIEDKTLLQKEIGKFVFRLAFFGISAFILIWIVNYMRSGDVILSLLFGLTIAMASIPEEIPVTFSSFMALGAYQMSKLGIISRQPQTIENLGAVSVICLDKTGTITENKMEIKTIYNYENDELINIDKASKILNDSVLFNALLASEVSPFDPMEKAIWDTYLHFCDEKIHDQMNLVYEYPLEGRPPMMTHVYEFNTIKKISGKGATERILKVCNVADREKQKINKIISQLSIKGYRVIGVASALHTGGDFPKLQDDFKWKFEGLLGFWDPPKKNILQVFKRFYNAGIEIKLITGDFEDTAVNIAEQVGMINYKPVLSGEEVLEMNAAELQKKVTTINLFARMFPEAKLKVIEALKANGEIVAMTGDGVNDAPALKSAQIGIAMGKGTEIARQASNLIITDDNLDKLADAVQQGRKIYSNLKKAIRYVISIHIPIILTASFPLLLGWKYPNIFTPVHIIFLELIMGPTCSIFYEREPAERNVMHLKPRLTTVKLFTQKELLTSIIQGIIIATGVLSLYFIFMENGYTLQQTRTVVFTTLVISNIFLTFTNRSFTENYTKTIYLKNNLALPVLLISVFFLTIIYLVHPVTQIFGMTSLTFMDLSICVCVAFVSVNWFELYKTYLMKTTPKSK